MTDTPDNPAAPATDPPAEVVEELTDPSGESEPEAPATDVLETILGKIDQVLDAINTSTPEPTEPEVPGGAPEPPGDREELPPNDSSPASKPWTHKNPFRR